ncbi:MAG: hypothetical protein HY343_02930 [Lentisphaerae bacterium]|nr:hypothetical protein [Lentisphaerota bacterium]
MKTDNLPLPKDGGFRKTGGRSKKFIEHPGACWNGLEWQGTMQNQLALSRYAMRLLGRGDPRHAKIWFVGLEDTTHLRNLSDLKRLGERSYITMNGCAGTHTSVYRIISKIVTALHDQTLDSAWRKYHDTELFSKESGVFLTNLYPLGKRIEAEWPENYRRWLRMTRKQYYRCLQQGMLPRFKYLREQHRRHKPHLTICCGKRHWKHFSACFALDGEKYEDVGRFRCYRRAKFVMTEFFRSTRMPDECIRHLVTWLNKEKLNPFTH